ncbi:CobW family GTP-binding protein [Caproiciproducens faecalis]|uniref:GTP-binding protein n=1 Tax=Caproiciproducens faecalis TaxID=2820301 RepID=A0ABS7DNL0_9FIRM|nr:GTP-binding protein [Caproiciproducens faecalis]MBW7572116.1 GTP-binding protein [Caproiciproducens faecalis]
MSTKIDIISGFLGSGKTTLIKKLLSEMLSSEKVVIIENEFGEIGIDGGILKDSGIQIREINAGCICCTLLGNFDAALKDVLKKYHPDRVIIEPSGVGKLSDITAACQKVIAQSDSEINIQAVIVDPIKYKMYIKNFSEFYSNQIECAKTIILSRTQKIDQAKLSEVVNDIRKCNPSAKIMTTPWEELSAQTILAAAEETGSTPLIQQEEAFESVHHHGHCTEHGHGHCNCEGHHHADDVFENWGMETPHLFSEEQIKNMLKKLSESEKYGTVLRAKGILPVSEKNWVQFDFVPEEFELHPIAPDYTGRLCVIGVNLNRPALAELFGV